MAEGKNSRTGLIALPVGMALLALLTVYVVVFSREEGRTTAGEVDGDLVAGTTGKAATASGDEPPAELARLWRAPALEAGTGGADAFATRLWANGETVTVVSTAGVTGYSTTDGARLWDVPLPDGATRPCAAAERTNAAGTGAVLYATASESTDPADTDPADADGAEESCSLLGVVDTGTGALLWSADLLTPDARPVAARDVTVTVGESTVTVNLDAAGTPAGFHRFDTATGTELPVPEPPDGFAGECPTGRQTLAIRHADSRVAVLTRCDGTPELSVYHADTGELEWTHPASDPEFGFTDILAGDPVLLHQGDALVAYSENGDELWRLPMAGLVPEESAVGGEVLIARHAPTDPDTDQDPDTDTNTDQDPDPDQDQDADVAVFTGYDLTDGSPLWEAELPGNVQLLDVDDTGRPLLGHAADGSLHLVRLDPADGTDTPAGTVPLDPRRTDDEPYVAYDEHQWYVMAAIETDTARGLRLHAFER
ncbi:outer membrane protein assembly factor BamB family protein [Streptomyces sp. URMC 129]|uniref:outer membrane protein assembly factor BamB family protein n=1 Tax=Streptomyces sp. URMC 129 TaxID=3423407 RepID=UPI003F529B76